MGLVAQSDSLVGRLVGRVVVGDTICLNAALLVARLTLFRSVVCPLLLLAEGKDGVWTLFLDCNYIPFFC